MINRHIRGAKVLRPRRISAVIAFKKQTTKEKVQWFQRMMLLKQPSRTIAHLEILKVKPKINWLSNHK